MSEAKTTIIGFNKYLDSLNDDLFKYLSMPEGIDTELVKNNIMFRGGEFEVLYSDPYFMQSSIKIWSDKWFKTFEKWNNALNIKYAPLENYDRFEDYTDTHAGTGSVDTTNKVDTKTTDDSESNTEHKVSAFDSNSYQPKDTENNTYDNTTTVENDGESNTKTKDNKTIEHHARLHGNIGVTTSQQMLEAELEVARFNLVDNITDVFLREYTIPIY